MEVVRRWVQTLGVAALGFGVLGLAVRPSVPAFAQEPAPVVSPPTCRLVDSGKLAWEKAGEDIAAQAEAFLAERGTREHVTVLPFGRMASGGGGSYSVVCLW